MSFINGPLYSHVKFVGVAGGLYPFSSRLSKIMGKAFTVSSTFAALAPTVLYFFDSLGNIDECVECLPGIIMGGGGFAKYAHYVLRGTNLEEIIFFMENDWKKVPTVREAQIRTSILLKGKILCAIYAVLGILSGIAFCGSPIVVPIMLDLLDPINETRPTQRLFPCKLFIDNDKYFALIYVHNCLAVGLAIYGHLGTDFFHIVTVAYACSKFELTREAIANVTKYDNECQRHLSEELTGYQERLFQKKIRLIFIKHKEALRIANMIENYRSSIWYTFTWVSVLFITICLTYIKMKIDDPEIVIRYGPCLLGAIGHLFIHCAIGQILSNYSDLNDSLNAVKWHRIPTRPRKMMKIMFIKCMKPYQLTAGGLFVFNMQTFGQLLKLAYSYFNTIDPNKIAN